MIELKNFQSQLIDKLLKFTSPSYNYNELIIKSPTGSGKTICLLSWIDEYLSNTDDNVSFIWFTPGSGELEEQSYTKSKLFASLNSQLINDALKEGFEKGTTTFINYERVIGKNKKAMLNESEKSNLEDMIKKAFLDNRKFIIILDEAHRNDTEKAKIVIDKFKAVKTVKVSATINEPEFNEDVEFYEVSEEDVINSGLITKAVVVNDNINIKNTIQDEISVLLDIAEEKRKEIYQTYLSKNIKNINPLVLIQLPDESTPGLCEKVEKYMSENLGKTYENQKLGIWLSERKRNHINVADLNDTVEYLIIKQAIATGWDAPRAKILVKIRENMGEYFTIQTVGRIRRMPEPKKGHYGIEVLDNSFLYTFDTEFLEEAFASGNGVKHSPLLKRHDKSKNLKLISNRVINFDTIINEKMILKNLHDGLVKKYNLKKDPVYNLQQLEYNGYITKNQIKSNYLYGKFDVLENMENLSSTEVWLNADYYDNRIDLIHAFHELSRIVHLPISKVEAMLKQFFLDKGKFTSDFNLVKLKLDEWTAFIINNWRIIREIFRKIEVDISIQPSFDFDINIKENEFTIPLLERYTFLPLKEQPSEIETNVYEGYNDNIIAARPSYVEKTFERYLEDKKEIIDMVYKNGDKGPQYFSLVYKTNGNISHFYPDFIIRTKRGEIYIIETKGGMDKYGNTKDRDEYSTAKFIAMKEYQKKYKVKCTFVRDFNEKLYYLEGEEWFDDMKHDNWKSIDLLWDN